MKSLLTRYITSGLTAGFIIFCQTRMAHAAGGVTTWSGAGGNQNWSTAANWTTVGGSTPPAAADTVIFNATGAAAGQGIVNNIVDPGFTAAISGLTISNDTATTWHTMQISSGNTLTVNGPFFVGGAANLITNATFTGGGSLVIAGANNVTVAATSGTATMGLDLSQLANFVSDSGTAGGAFSIGLVNPSSGSFAGTINLAAVSNNITASTMTVAENNNGTCNGILNLGGGTNIINAGTINMGWDKCNATIQFYTNTGSLMLRNAAGTGGANINMGDNAHSGSASGSFTSRINLTGHYVDMSIGTLELANRHARSGGGHTAIFAFDTGVVNCTTINMGINQAAAAPARSGGDERCTRSSSRTTI